MKRSLQITALTIVFAFLSIPAVIHAQTDQIEPLLPLEQPFVCEESPQAEHSFIVKITKELSSLLDKIRVLITGSGGKFKGNAECGAFDGKSVLGTVKIKYRSISADEVEIIIEDKPFILPSQTIEAAIKKYLS